MKYKEYKESRQSEFNALPIFFAFSKEQFKTAMEKRGLNENDTDKVYSLGAGGYYLRKDAEQVRSWFNKPDPIDELMKDYDFAKDAIYYEMCNHEYAINMQGNWEVCNCFTGKELPYYGDDVEGDEVAKYADIMDWNDDTRRAWKDARRQYYKDAAEHEWF